MPKKTDSAEKLSKTNASKPAKAKVSVVASATEPAAPVKRGRPSSYSDEVALEICTRIAQGESLRSICADDSLPTKTSVFRWLEDESRAFFRDQYARAREKQADFYADQIIEIADEGDTTLTKEGDIVFDATAVARNRLRVDARKWYASKVAPKKYGDRQTIDLNAEVVTLTEEQRKARLLELQAKLALPTK